MYIEPRTNIRLLHNVPLDESFDHTIYFANANAQANFFMSKQKYNLTNYTYQRVRRGWARVGINAENLYDCNYMMFQNTSFGNKWFYAFIKSVEYINNEVSEIQFELDPMQSWFFDYEREYCFVERNHTATDVIGEHIEPESVDTGEYVFNADYHKLIDFTDLTVIIAVVEVQNQSGLVNGVEGKYFDRTYSGATYFIYDPSDVSGINTLLNNYLHAPDSVVAMYMCPRKMVLADGVGIPQDHKIPNNHIAPHYIVNEPAITTLDTLDGYKPKNNKMYTYPYNFVHLDDGQGSELVLRYEFFKSLMPVVDIIGTFTPPSTCVLKPKFYKNNYVNEGSAIPLGTENLTLGGFPMCSWNTDAFKAWFAQNSLPMTGGIVGSGTALGLALAGAIAVAPAAMVAMGIGLAGMVGKALISGYKASIEADIQKGDFNNANANFAKNYLNFYCGRLSCNRVYARRIDDYFTRYGYAIGINAIPQINVRPHWTFVKTLGCTIKGSIPSDDMKKICDIYDNGITFWRNGNEVGNYSLDNSPEP